jgi:O-antigen/teichoic acid export membrane protein
MGGFEDTAHFAAAQRLAWPLMITLSAVGGTLYSVAAAAWPHDVPRLELACQRGFDTVVVVGLAAVAAGIAGAEFLLALIGPEMVAGAPAFGVLLVLCVVKAISMTVGPALLVVGAQRVVLTIVGVALMCKLLAGLAVIPHYGFVGLAWSALGVESCCVMVPILVVVGRRAGIRLRYGMVLRAVLICAVSTLATKAWLGSHGLWPVLMAPTLYLALALATGTLRPSELKRFRQSGAAG